MSQPPQTTPTAAPSTGVAPARVPASLHVAELDPRVDETVLMQIFSAVAHVASVKLVRDKVTSQSMGYAYINFESDDQAQLAMDKLNFSKIYGRVIRVSYTRDRQSNNQPRAKRNNKANLYVKNLDPSIDSQQLYQLFKNFGAITSVRVMEHPDGKSKGFGFVCFENENDAQAAINDMNDYDLKGKPIHVSLAINQVQQPGQGGGRHYQSQMMMMGPMGPVAVPPMGVVPAHGAPHPGVMVPRGVYEYSYDPTLYYGTYPAPYGYPAPYPPYAPGYLPAANYPAENSSAAPTSASSTTQPQSQ